MHLPTGGYSLFEGRRASYTRKAVSRKREGRKIFPSLPNWNEMWRIEPTRIFLLVDHLLSEGKKVVTVLINLPL